MIPILMLSANPQLPDTQPWKGIGYLKYDPQP